MLLIGLVWLLGRARPYVEFSARRLFGAPLLALAVGAAAALGGLWLACRAAPGTCGNDWLSGGVKGVAYVAVFLALLLALEGRTLRDMGRELTQRR